VVPKWCHEFSFISLRADQITEPLVYEVELVFSFKGIRRVEVPPERIRPV